MSGEAWNLVAAIFCTIGAVVGAVALALSGWTLVNLVAFTGAVIGILGGIAWIAAAAIALQERQ